MEDNDNALRYKIDHVIHPCPKCGAAIYWSCPGDVGYAYCANSSTATRVWKKGEIHKLVLCDWTGNVSRRPDGKVEIYYSP